MEFLKAGEPVESNIFNQLDEKKRALIDKGVDVINLSIGTPDFQPDQHVMEAVSRAALDPDMYKYSLTETPELLDAVEKWYKRRRWCPRLRSAREPSSALHGSWLRSAQTCRCPCRSSDPCR